MVYTQAANPGNMCRHSELAVQSDPKVVDGWANRDQKSAQLYVIMGDFTKLQSSAKPNELGLVGVQLEMVRGHPFFYRRNAHHQLGEGRSQGRRLGVEVNLGVIGIAMRL